MTRRSRFILLVFTALCLLMLTGCGAKLNTELKISTSFSGTRTMTMEIKPSDFERIEGGATAVERIISENCPKQLETGQVKLNDDGNREYSFTLSFANMEEYQQKLSEILGREPVIQFSRPDNILASGFRISEDFTSNDLMSWLREAVLREKLASESMLSSLWSMGDAVLLYDGESYRTGQAIQVDRIKSHRVELITISTSVKEDGFLREIKMNFPSATVHELGTSLKDYFDVRIPAGAQAQWEENFGSSTLKISLMAKTAEELQGMSRQIFSSSEQMVEYSQDMESSTVLCDQKIFSETLDLSVFSSGGSGVRLQYIYESKEGNEPVKAYVYKGGNWEESGNRDGMTFIYGDTVSLLNIRLLNARQYYIRSGELCTTRLDNDKFERRIVLKYDAASQSGASDYACDYYRERLGTDVNTECVSECSEGIEQAILTITGSDSEISERQSKLFGLESFFTYVRSRGALSFRNNSTFTDHINWDKILVGDNKNASIEYILDMGEGESISKLHCVAQDGKNGGRQEDYFSDDSGEISFKLPSGNVEITAYGEALNWTGIAIIGGIVVCVILILVFIILLIINSDRSGDHSEDTELLHITDDEKKRLALKEAEERALTKL